MSAPFEWLTGGHDGIFHELNSLCLHSSKNSSGCAGSLWIVNRVLCGFPLLCFPKFVLLVHFVVVLVVFNCMRHCPLGYIYIYIYM